MNASQELLLHPNLHKNLSEAHVSIDLAPDDPTLDGNAEPLAKVAFQAQFRLIGPLDGL